MVWGLRTNGLTSTQRVKEEPTVPAFLQPANRFWNRVAALLRAELNFYRIHVLFFVFVPLIAACIFWGSNEDNNIPFIDCYFVCVSAMTVTGLVTINISTATIWQQVILFILMWIGNISAVSVTMIAVRRHFFRVKFDRVIKSNAAARKRAQDVEQAHNLEKRKEMIRLRRMIGLGGKHRHHRSPDDSDDGLSPATTSSTQRMAEAELEAERLQRLKKKKEVTKKRKGPLTADMVVRVDQPAVLINGNGIPSSGRNSPRRSIEEEDDSRRPMPEQSTVQQGSILNTSEEHPHAGSSGGQQPFVRVSSPPELSSLQTQRRKSILSAEDGLTESPQELRQSSGNSKSATPEVASIRFEEGLNPVRSHQSEGKGKDEAEGGDATRSPGFPSLPRIDQGRMTHFDEDAVAPSTMRRRRGSDPSGADRERTRRGSESALNPNSMRPYGQLRSGALGANGGDRMPRSQTIEFADPPRVAPGDRRRFQQEHPERGYTTGVIPPTGVGMQRQRTLDRTYTAPGFTPLAMTRTTTMTAKQRGFGGFPTPFEIAGNVLSKALPRAREKLMRSTTMPRTATIASTHAYSLGKETDAASKTAPYLSFDVSVSGNSMFHSLTEAQRDELGGVEYRALDFLAKIVPIYFFGVIFFMVVLVAPYLASRSFDKYRPVFESQAPHVPNTTWFWLFQTISAYSNTGMSLIDTSMTNLSDAYFLLIPMGILILIGNTAFPIFLRFWIWICSLCVPKESRSYETLRFILDHPRRCFVYLFPSSQTWFLLAIIIGLTATDWIAFEVLDIGNPQLEEIPVPQRIFDGLFQSLAVRAAGFQVVSLLDIAPAVQFLYVVMMYISAYPLALSVRSTNVYEERSLGVFTEKGGDDDEEEELPSTASARKWGSYLSAHARRQLAFDMWWLGFALWLVCIIERTQIQDADSNGWFTVFSCLFELTSAYGTVGLSTGTPYDNFSLSGRFRTLSKLVVIATMTRGRHRGLPVAIDRSILLPNDLDEQDAAEEAWSIVENERNRSMDVYRSGSIPFPTPYYQGGERGGIMESDYKENSPSPMERTPSRINSDPQSQYTGFAPVFGLSESRSPEKPFYLDAIREDKGATPQDTPKGEEAPYTASAPTTTAADTSPSVSSLESGRTTGSIKGKERQRGPSEATILTPSSQRRSSGADADPAAAPQLRTAGVDDAEGDDPQLLERYGSSGDRMTEGPKSASVSDEKEAS
ncbi:TrkH-domain-containing protein [Microstroma glucosiphilum]|uniref:TrkH-domain-containing protein n=1 Tax=Pseudomicrostroma glucosiphilum TaxID=1684307 RepID=A0A316U667_9BASI|nr:TrkH-domain-containing protein [Pseudomicrostroma glucosiphilum]PWN20324.1 TrkH-domain-containing protein [Pseudomicrostroma glucosiphilum]